MSKEKAPKKMSFPVAVFTLLVLIVVMAVGLAVLKLGTVTVFALVLVAMSLIALFTGFSMEEVQDTILDGCKKAILVILILMSVGMVVGSWIVSGVDLRFCRRLISCWWALLSAVSFHSLREALIRRRELWAWPLWESATASALTLA